MPEPSRVYKIWKYGASGLVSVSDKVACEEPLQITVDGTPVAVVMRTPGHDPELVAGFLRTEGLVTSYKLSLIHI